ncbi:hypothetical protein [Bosea sp. TND4EK4]|uniref:hypothetical protein n=1 Tax=Bosea sp. TND4EK4 TaxID=1907408 RepID=UPI001115AC9E|nr:hypothetical protein [Bosea sp. TND4EK4]
MAINKSWLQELDFTPAGQLYFKAETLAFRRSDEFGHRTCPGVYLWLVSADDGYDVLYVGKAGRTLEVRMAQHGSGSRPASQSKKGLQNAAELRKYLPDKPVEVWFRPSEQVLHLGVQIYQTSLDEEALLLVLKDEFANGRSLNVLGVSRSEQKSTSAA